MEKDWEVETILSLLQGTLSNNVEYAAWSRMVRLMFPVWQKALKEERERVSEIQAKFGDRDAIRQVSSVLQAAVGVSALLSSLAVTAFVRSTSKEHQEISSELPKMFAAHFTEERINQRKAIIEGND